ncbi:MAG: arginine--tRNA ligase [Clostridiales Family XIII bacterium]|nr:arginine--tRNA ligase [Clostridiales Family XIII bacterium]
MKDFRREIAVAIAAQEKIKEVGLDEASVYEILEVPADEKMGDYAFPCFRLAKAFKKAPNAIAEKLAGLITVPAAEKVENVAAYINFYLDRGEVAAEVLKTVLSEGDGFGSSLLGKGKTAIVEYSSPNIAKPFHIGHIRSTVIGSAIGNIMKFLGYDVTRINHLGDYGTQFGKLIVAYRRYGSKEEVEAEPIKTLLKYYVEFHKLAEDDPTLEVEARETFSKLEQGAEEEYELWKWFREESLKEFTVVYEMLGIEFDSYAGESFYSDKMDRVIDELEEKNLLQESDGAMIVDLEEYDLGKALIKKSDGSTLYITRDIAAAIYRKETYDFYKNLYIVASQQDLHFKQWIKIVELMGYDWAADCVHIPFGLVRLENGAMQTRTGNVVFLEDVLRGAVEKTREIIIEKAVNTDDVEEMSKTVGIGAVIFQELHNNRIKDYTFSWDKVLNFEGETGPYVQYSHARAASLLKRASEDGIVPSMEGLASASKYLTSDSSFALVKALFNLPETIEEAGLKYEPSILTRHIVDIAQAFNGFYHEEHIFALDAKERDAKLLLVKCAKQALANSLGLLGVGAPERM